MSAPDRSRPVLVVEAATAAGSVALFVPARSLTGGRPSESVYERAVPMGAGTADGLFPAIMAVLDEAALAPDALGAVVCGGGPGSFTSLRIAAALAKGLAHGVGCPLYAVPSLGLAAAGVAQALPSGQYVVHADALRGERYVLEVMRGIDGRVQVLGSATRRSVEELLSTTTDGARIAVGAAPESLPSAHVATPCANALWRVEGEWLTGPVELAHWEPAYGRLAEAQVKWEASHGRALDGPAGG